MIKVSIIVPVYNAEGYIEKCLDSLIAQTLKEIEIIAIDDGSTDNTSKLLMKYKDRIKIIHQKNKGVASARNRGLKEAKGEYIAFVDSDDWVNEDMLKKLYQKAKSQNFDCVMCNFSYVDDEKIWDGTIMPSNDIIDLSAKKKFLITMFPVIWNKIYKREKIVKFKFKDGVWAEDVEYLYRILTNIDNIGVINDKLYYYYQRLKSESRLYDERIYSYIHNFNGIIDFYKKNNLYKEYKLELEYCYVRYIYATFVKRATYFENKKDYKKAVDTAIKNVKEAFPKYRKNKYFYKSPKGIYLTLFNKVVAYLYYDLKKLVGG